VIPALGLVNLPSVGLSAADIVVVSLLVACVVCQAWCLKTMRTSLAALPALDERVARLTRSVALLVDTTEGCFEAVSAQLVRNDDTVTPRRQQRQRRVVGAAKRGRTVAQIAAEEDVAEGEVALRVRMARDLHTR
jgi:signal transduction histidine kinase